MRVTNEVGAYRVPALPPGRYVLRVLAARWLGLGPEQGALFKLDTGTLSVLGYERETPVVLRWNA